MDGYHTHLITGMLGAPQASSEQNFLTSLFLKKKDKIISLCDR
jgi:hypothetical protein